MLHPKLLRHLLNTPIFILIFLDGLLQVIKALPVDPKFRTCSQVTGETECGIRGQGTFSIEQLVGSRVADMHITGKAALADAHSP